ncbi:hypothetical protein PR048_013498 [Dryococelus australis]|uniref:Uncharacterized protein n=1 Tax=Dryococelus australis TaxID=614101 RepID=A0ABQ9HSC2_9NEOP|nr:hypothetical protein PR048_013498 [Dryococelus australis]
MSALNNPHGPWKSSGSTGRSVGPTMRFSLVSDLRVGHVLVVVDSVCWRRSGEIPTLFDRPRGERQPALVVPWKVTMGMDRTPARPHAWFLSTRDLANGRINLGLLALRGRDSSPPPIGRPQRALTARSRLDSLRLHPRIFHIVIAPEDAAGRRVFSGISRSRRPCVPALLHTHLVLGEIWAAPSIEVLRADEGEVRRVWSSAGMQGWGKQQILEKPRHYSCIARHDSIVRKLLAFAKESYLYNFKSLACLVFSMQRDYFRPRTVIAVEPVGDTERPIERRASRGVRVPEAATGPVVRRHVPRGPAAPRLVAKAKADPNLLKLGARAPGEKGKGRAHKVFRDPAGGRGSDVGSSSFARGAACICRASTVASVGGAEAASGDRTDPRHICRPRRPLLECASIGEDKLSHALHPRQILQTKVAVRSKECCTFEA